MSGYSMDLGNGFKDSDYSPRESPSGSESFRSLEQANASVSASAICDLGGAPVVYSKGIAYFQDVCDAAALVRRANADWRVVAYELGYAVQYVRSGAYFPEMEA